MSPPPPRNDVVRYAPGHDVLLVLLETPGRGVMKNDPLAALGWQFVDKANYLTRLQLRKS